MRRVGRHRRRSDMPGSSHERARSLAAERIDGPLEPIETTWLDEHLAGCAPCRSVAAAYETDRLALRDLRDLSLEVPRDMWARTAAAIERESASRRGVRGRTGAGRARSLPALGILAGVAVIAVVIGASALSGGFLGGSPGIALVPAGTSAVDTAATAAAPGATPIVVGAGAVRWVNNSTDGYAYNVTSVEQVCPQERQPDCAPVADHHSKQVAMNTKPKSIFQSPVQNQAIVVGSDGSGGDAVVVIALPTPEPSATPIASPSPSPSTEPSESPRTTATLTPTASPSPSASILTTAPTVTPTPTASVEPSASVEVSPSPSVSPEPTVAATLAIVSGVAVVGQSAAYSPDGSWFAFTARPSDGSLGPDIYVWRVGDEQARAVTIDHRSVFASWVGQRMLGSRPATTATAATDVAAQSFFIDPASGTETALTGAVWRPVVDPAGHWAVEWDGTVRLGKDGLTTGPAKGTLVLRGFRPDVGSDVSDPTPAVVADGSVTEFDARWDETGTWLAVWLADPSDPTIGRLSLIRVDPVTGGVDHPKGAPESVAALPGFSITDGRLAWVTPPNQDGEGSRIQIVAWTDDAVGAVESGPGKDLVVVH